MNKTDIVAIVFFFVAIHTGTVAWGQKQDDSLATVYGKLFDTDGQAWASMFKGAPNVMLTDSGSEETDTLYTAAAFDGSFIFRNLIPRKIRLKVTCVGMKTIENEYVLEPGRNVIYLTLYPQTEKIKESGVSAEVPLMKRIADTTIFNAAAVRTLDGESVRSILEQLPGFNVTSSGIQVDGENVKRTYVNGVLIFGDNPLTAVDALKADEITQVRVFDEQNAADIRSGLKHNKKDRVLDIVTKEKIFSFSEAVLYAAGGADDTRQERYEGIGSMAYYSEMTLFNISAMTDNIGSNHMTISNPNPSNILSQIIFGNGPLPSYVENTKANTNFTKYWKDRNFGNSINVSYTFNYKYSKDERQTLTEYFGNTDSPATSYLDTTLTGNSAFSHNINISADLKDTPLKSIFIMAYGSFDDNSNSSLTGNRAITEGQTADIFRHETLTSENKDYKIGGSLSWINNDARKVRPNIYIRGDYRNSSTLSWTVDTLATSFDRRQLSSDGYGRSAGMIAEASLETRLINNEKHTLLLNTGLGSYYKNEKRKQMTVDFIAPDSPATDFANTYDFTWNYFTNSIFAGIAYNSKILSISGKLEFSDMLMMNDEFYPSEYSYDKNYLTVAPVIELRYKKLRFSSKTRTTAPSLEQVRSRISDSNPLMLIGGNPDLKPSYNTDYLLSWQKTVGTKGASVGMQVNGTCNFRDIVDKSVYFSEATELSEWDGYKALAGSRLITYENAARPSYQINGWLTGSRFFFKRKLRVTMNLTGGWAERLQYLGQDMIDLSEASAGMRLYLRYTIGKNIRINVNPSVTYIKSMDGSMATLSERISADILALFDARFAKNGSFNAEYRFNGYDYLSGYGSDFSSHILNARIGWKFLKGTLEVSLVGNDLLNSGSLYTTLVSPDSMTQSWQPTYGRYFLVSVAYHFRAKK